MDVCFRDDKNLVFWNMPTSLFEWLMLIDHETFGLHSMVSSSFCKCPLPIFIDVKYLSDTGMLKKIPSLSMYFEGSSEDHIYVLMSGYGS